MSQMYGYDMSGNYVPDAPASDGWSNLLTDLVKGYTQIETAKQTAKTTQAQRDIVAYTGGAAYTPYTLNSTTGLTTGVTSMLPVLAVGAGVLALLYFAFKDSK